jgi:hypothetical protein
MKHTVCKLIVPAAALLLCALISPVLGQNAAASGAKDNAPAKEEATVAAEKSAPAAKEAVLPENSGGSDSHMYFEYQVITVPKKTLTAAAESMGLPKDSEPTNELLPAIYKAGGYRVIGYSAGYAAARTPAEFKMSRTEFFPVFYIMPNGSPEPSYDDGDEEYDMDGADETVQEEGGEEDGGEDDGNDPDDGEDGGEDEDYDPYDDYRNAGNNLASIFPFFGDPTLTGNDFYLDIRPPNIFSMDSTMRKLNGFTNIDYGEWGRGQSPVFDDNSFSSTLAATRGKPMIVAKAPSGNAWTLHVFFTQGLPMPEKTAPVNDSDKLVRLDFQIVRAKWNDICAAGSSDGCPGVPSDDFMEKLLKSNQLRDFYSPTFLLVPSQEPVAIQLNAKRQFVPLKWIPAQELGVPGIPLNSESIWTGTILQAAARILNEGKTVRLDYYFEKTTQTGWRNYQYSFFGEPEEPEQLVPVQNRYARPQAPVEPEILSGLLKLPMLDTTAFRQALYLEVGKPVLAARISNPAYQPDMLTLLFVTATIESVQ